MKKLMLCFILGMFMISLGSAGCPDGDDCVGSIERQDQFGLFQTCNNCTECNFTIVKAPNKSIILSGLIGVETQPSYFEFNVTGGNHTTLGEYSYCYSCGNSEESETGCLYYEVGGTGISASTPQAIMYGIVLFILLVLFILTFMWFNNIEWGHYTSSEGVIIQVNTDRTKKIALFFLSYLLLLLLLFTGKSMTENFMFINDTPVFFDVFFNILLISIAPVTIAVISLWILVTITDDKLQESILRGLEI